MAKKKGALHYDRGSGRYDIHFKDGSYYGGLHCGECLDIRLNEVWVPSRIEIDDDWYLVGLPGLRLEGLNVRIGY